MAHGMVRFYQGALGLRTQINRGNDAINLNTALLLHKYFKLDALVITRFFQSFKHAKELLEGAGVDPIDLSELVSKNLPEVIF